MGLRQQLTEENILTNAVDRLLKCKNCGHSIHHHGSLERCYFSPRRFEPSITKEEITEATARWRAYYDKIKTSDGTLAARVLQDGGGGTPAD